MRINRSACVGAIIWCAAVSAEPSAKGLTVHEWGIFTAHDDADVANADVRAEWDGLPDFIYGRIKGRVLPLNWGPLEIRYRPLIFFHSDKPIELRVRVSFPGGQPGVWWPGTQTPAAKGLLQPAKTDFLEWKLGVDCAPAGFVPRQSAPAVPKGHWIETARAVKCGDVFAAYGEQQFDCDREKFVFYDGIFPQGKWVRVVVGKDGVSLDNRTKHAVFDLTVVDRRAAGKVRVGRVARLDAGTEVKSVELAESDAGRFVAEASTALTGQLTAAGLNADEAAALVAFRKDDFFSTDGVQVFYRIPQDEYDRLMPLTVEPRPGKTVRIGLVLHPHCEPELAEKVLSIVRELNADDFAARDAAVGKLAAMGRAAFTHLVRLRKTDLPAEVRSRIELVLERWEARKAFPKE
jgi:hypothetical protein